MPSSVRQKALDIRSYIEQKLGTWEDPNPEADQRVIEDLSDNECDEFLTQIYEKAKRPARPIPAI